MIAANPFASRFLRPGAIAYVFDPAAGELPAGSDRLGELAEAILSVRCGRAAIVGPHGTGKSTLLADLRRYWRGRGLRVAEIDTGVMREPQELRRNIWLCPSSDILTIDGFERLGLGERLLVRLTQWRRRCNVVVTSHHDLGGYQSLYRTNRTPQIEAAVLAALLRDCPGAYRELLHSEFWSRSRIRHGENLRESLFDAYDWARDRAASRGG